MRAVFQHTWRSIETPKLTIDKIKTSAAPLFAIAAMTIAAAQFANRHLEFARRVPERESARNNRKRIRSAPWRKSRLNARCPTSEQSCTRPTHTTGGRENGVSRSSDGRLDVKLSTPGSVRIGTNPEQLFAAGWSACFESAIGLAASKKKIILPADLAIDAEVDLNLADGGYFLSTRLNVSLPGVEPEVAQALVDEADQLCPYSKAMRGNIDVTIDLV